MLPEIKVMYVCILQIRISTSQVRVFQIFHNSAITAEAGRRAESADYLFPPGETISRTR